MKKLLLASTCLMASLAPTGVFAQEQVADAGAAAGAAQMGIQDIVVTAQRRSENLQHAPIAVSAVSGEALAQAGVSRPTELTSVIPSLQVTQAAGPYNLFYLRGVGNFNGNAFSDSAIAFNFDGVYIGRPSSSTGFFYDLERVEVLKGPQGTLYGRNATGGAINVISHRPDLNAFEGEGSIEYGNYDAVRLDGAINVPLGEQAAFRVAGIYVKHDPYMSDGSDNQKDWGLRGSFRVEPDDALSINIVADYFHQGGSGPGATIVGTESAAFPPASGIVTTPGFDPDDRIGFLSPQGQAYYTSQPNALLGRNFYGIPSDQRAFQDDSFWGISATIDWRTSLGTLTIIPAYRESKLDYLSYTPGFYIRQKEYSNQGSVEARFATPEDKPLRALIGAFYYNEETKDPFVAYLHQSNGTYETNVRLNTESEALFGRLTWAVTPDLRLNAGARQTWDHKTFTGEDLILTRICTDPPFAQCPNAPPLPYDPFPQGLTGPGQIINPALGPAPYGGFPDPFNTGFNYIQTATLISDDQRANFKRTTYHLGADWDVTPHNLLYASFETGFKAGGFFFSHDNGTYRPETITAFTVGSKNRFFDNRLQLNVELFRWRYRNQQISHLTYDSNGTSIFATENVGRATFQGAEVEIKLAPSDTTTLGADIQYLDAKYNNFVYTTPNQNGGFFNGTGCGNASAPGTVYTVDCSNQRPPNAPKWTLNFSAQQRVPTSFGDFVIDARAHHQTSTLTGLEFLPLEYQPAYWLVDAAVTWYAPEKRYFIGGFINNMFDETVMSATFPTPFSSMIAGALRPPRTYGVRAGVKF